MSKDDLIKLLDNKINDNNKDSINLAKKLVNNLYYIPKVDLKYPNFVIFYYELNDDEFIILVYKNQFIISLKSSSDGRILYDYEMYKVVNMVKLFFLKEKLKKCVLFTGAFNPPTIAHYNVIISALKDGFDGVIIALSNNDFLKKKMSKSKNIDKDMVFSENERLEMMLSMTKDLPNVFIFGIEDGYTYEMLCKVKDSFDLEELYFAMGSDKLSEINRWGFASKLLSLFKFYVLTRNNEENVEEKCKDVFKNTEFIITLTDEKYQDISSTSVRINLLNNKEIDGLVHSNVLNFLRKDGN